MNNTQSFQQKVHAVLTDIETMLVEKNRAYGDSALNPVRVFSTADPREQLRVRIDDTLSRLARGKAAGEDTVKDLLGYLVLLLISENEGKDRDPIECLVSCEGQR